MNKTQRIVAVAIAGAMLLAGFVFGRVSDGNRGASAEENQAATSQLTSGAAPNAVAATANTDQTFYLKDYKVGYDEGYQAGVSGQTANVINTDREGYNEGFKKGYADAYQAQQNQPAKTQAVSSRGGQQLAYKPVAARSSSRGNSKLKTALTIAAPAAIGAGIGAAAGGGKGAAAGALIGGGGGALYHVIKNRNRD